MPQPPTIRPTTVAAWPNDGPTIFAAGMPQIITALATADDADFQRCTSGFCREIAAIANDSATDHCRAAQRTINDNCRANAANLKDAANDGWRKSSVMC